MEILLSGVKRAKASGAWRTGRLVEVSVCRQKNMPHYDAITLFRRLGFNVQSLSTQDFKIAYHPRSAVPS
jgi:hypothetical protein